MYMNEMNQLVETPKYSVEELVNNAIFNCSDAKLLAIVWELSHLLEKRIGSVYDECCHTVDEETPNENYELNEDEYAFELDKLQREAKEILVKELSWDKSIEDREQDLLKELGIEM